MCCANVVVDHVASNCASLSEAVVARSYAGHDTHTHIDKYFMAMIDHLRDMFHRRFRGVDQVMCEFTCQMKLSFG